MLLCGRCVLLHRGMGDGSPPCPASIYLDGTILLHNSTDCKVISNGPKGPFFVVQRAAVYGDGSQVARHGLSRGAGPEPGIRRGTRLVPLHGISPLWAWVKIGKPVPVGYSVAVMPCGA